MFTSRNIHFAILGIILGASSGYILAFYQVQKSMPPPQMPAASSAASSESHPDVSNEQLLAMFKEALEKNPNNTDLMTRYANFLFDLGRFSESVAWFEKVLSIEPNKPDVLADLGTAYWNSGQKAQAMAQYRKSLAIDPKHMATLHNIVVAHLEEREYPEAEKVLNQMEGIDSRYPGLDALKKRLAIESKGGR